jgi:glycosyltransferase involved in cell wall biosynthesis
MFGSTATCAANGWFKKLISNKRNIVTACGDARDAYKQAPPLVHPSLQDNYGLAMPEALTYGLPVVVTENTGAKDLIKEGVNGFIIPIRDSEAIKEKIMYYYRKKDERARN